MNEQIFFEYLQGKWLIERKIVDKSSRLHSASAFGKVDIIKTSKNILNYQELLKVKWGNNFSSNSHKQYDYVLDNSGCLGLYNYDDKRSFMFNLIFDPNLNNVIKGQYQCIQDSYLATYKIINYKQFILIFQVNGPKKDCSIISSFVKGS
ncbi:MAG: DUF6314 family protein [Rickettsiaceae bacterium]